MTAPDPTQPAAPPPTSLAERFGLAGALDRVTLLELAVAAAIITVAAILGPALGWSGKEGHPVATPLWPFYVSTWDYKTVWNGRVLAPVLAFLCAWPAIRRWGRGEAVGLGGLVTIVAGAYLFHLALGMQRYGVEAGLRMSFNRGVEYWRDVPSVTSGFLARFPSGVVSLHGSTHPPGLILFLYAGKRLGFSGVHDLQIFTSMTAAGAALPLWGAARRLWDEATARWAVVLFLFACVVSAFAMAAMDTVTMFFGALALYGLARALDGSLLGGVIWGVGLAAVTLCNFIGFALGLSYAAILVGRLGSLERRHWLALAAGPAAFLAAYGVLAVGFGYRPIEVFLACWRKFHEGQDTHRPYGVAVLGNTIAFFGAMGLPLAGLAGHTVVGAFRRLLRGGARAQAALVLAGALPPLGCIALATPRFEVEHIFLLFVPATVMGMAGAARSWYARPERWLTHVAIPIAAAQSILLEIFYYSLW